MRTLRLSSIFTAYKETLGLDICHRGCAYTVLKTVQRHGVQSTAYDTVHYKEPLKSFIVLASVKMYVGQASQHWVDVSFLYH